MMPTPPVAYNSLGAVISIAVLGSLLVALMALVIGYRYWQKGKERQHLAVAYSSGRLDSSEYVMPGELACGQGTHRSGTGLLHPSLDPGEGKWGAGGRRGSEGRSQPSGDRIPRPGSDQEAPMSVSAFADIPASYSRCYSNPSYHTLSQCSPSPPPPNKVSAGGGVRCGQTDGCAPASLEGPSLHVPLQALPVPPQVPGGQLFASLQAPERLGGVHGRDNHASLPADRKRRREPPPGRPDRGRSLEAKALCAAWHAAPSECVCLQTGFWASVLGEAGAWGGARDLMPHRHPAPQVAAAWTEVTAVATATAVVRAPSAVKVSAGGGGGGGVAALGLMGWCQPEPDCFPAPQDPSLKRGWGPVWLP